MSISIASEKNPKIMYHEPLFAAGSCKYKFAPHAHAALRPSPYNEMDSNIPVSELGLILSTAGAQIASLKYAMLACFSLFVYDYLLTFNDELDYMWRRKFTFVTFAYLINRYYAMFWFILLIVANFSMVIGASANCLAFESAPTGASIMHLFKYLVEPLSLHLLPIWSSV